MEKKRDAYGGNGDIFFSDDNLTATKCLRNRSTKEKINRYKREIDVMQSLMEKQIPNIVEVISIDLDDDHPENSKIIMRKYDGCLPELISLTKGNVKFSLGLLLPIIRALKILSENTPAIYHRDIKPENILYKEVNGEYELFLTDFGICFLNDDETRLTQEITAVGARMFIAPEYEIGRVEKINEKGDIFSIGKVIWWMINGIENALLPSNFWFVDEFDLSNCFPGNPDIVAANVIIASCLRINPDERCNYDQLIAMINNVLNENATTNDEERQHLVESAMEKRKIQFAEKLMYNKQLVNLFSSTLLKSLDKINEKYPAINFLHTLRKEYGAKSKDGVDYTGKNVNDDAAHYLYSKSFDDLYIPINYNPAPKGEKYANITFDYNIRSSGRHGILKVKYNEQGVIVAEYQSSITILTPDVVIAFLEDMISDYIA